MLTPEIIELCKQASVEQEADRLLYFITEINRLIAIRDDEKRKRGYVGQMPGNFLLAFGVE